MIGPRSFRRLMPAIGWLGPLAFGRPTHAFAAQVEAILAADETLTERLGTIEVPTLVVVGNQDILTPRGDSEELAELIPTAELVVISGAAHGLMIEHASTFNRVLMDFLRRAETAYQARLAAAAATAADPRRGHRRLTVLTLLAPAQRDERLRRTAGAGRGLLVERPVDALEAAADRGPALVVRAARTGGWRRWRRP